MRRIPEQIGILMCGLFFLSVWLLLSARAHDQNDSAGALSSASAQTSVQIDATNTLPVSETESDPSSPVTKNDGQSRTSSITTEPNRKSTTTHLSDTMASPSTSKATSTGTNLSAVDRCLQLAAQAESENRLSDASDLYRQILTDLDPDSRVAYDRIIALDRNRSLSTIHAKADSVRKELGHRFKRYLTQHFIIISDADSNWVRAQGGRLERTHHQFFRVARRLGLKPLPLTERLLCIVFDNHEEFMQYATRHNEVEVQWVAGYYSPRSNYIVFYNTATSPSFQSAWETLKQWEVRLDETQSAWREAQRIRQTARASQLREQSQQLQKTINGERKRLQNMVDSVVTVKTVHEATHQLAFNTNVQSRIREYPFWITEGLAVCMETEQTSSAFGPEYQYETRRQRFEQLLENNQLLPLDRFITLKAVPNNAQQQADIMYHQSYALFSWMYRFRKDALARYMLALNGDKGSPYDTSLNLGADLFAEYFGNPTRVEQDWLKWERSQK